MPQLRHLRRRTHVRAGPRRKLLLIDDDAADVRLFQEGFRALQIPHDLGIVRGGAEALRQLTAESVSSPLPALILLKALLPEVDGFGVLAALRADPKLRAIPVIMLGSTGDPGSVHRAYELGANAWVQKPIDDFVDLIGDIDRFWLRRAVLPVQ